MSNLIDIYCTYFISKTIDSKTEAAKSMIGENAYISQKKYVEQSSVSQNVQTGKVMLETSFSGSVHQKDLGKPPKI